MDAVGAGAAPGLELQDNLQDQLLGKACEWAARAQGYAYRREVRKQYMTNEDFSRMLTVKRMMVIGCTGAGKSTLCNKMAGYRYEWLEAGSEGRFQWTTDPDDLLFACKDGAKSVTQHTTFANMHFLGNAERPFVCIDTPGHDDTGTDDCLAKQATDMHVKLKQMGYVNTILVLHNDVWSCRFSPATVELLAKTAEMFKKSNGNVWNHVMIGFSRCDEADRGWRGGFQGKVREVQAAIRARFPDCNVDVPVVALSGTDEPGLERSQSASFEQLWNFLHRSDDLSTTNLQEFEGMTLRLKRVVKERDGLQRLAAARKHFLTVFIQVFLLLMCLNCRPGFFNMSGAIDEILIIVAFIYVIGPLSMCDFLLVCWADHLLPQLDSMFGGMLRQLGFDICTLNPIPVPQGRPGLAKRPTEGGGESAAKRQRVAADEVPPTAMPGAGVFGATSPR